MHGGLWNGPDGGCLPTGTNILSTGGISGIVDDFEDAVWDDNMWLVGVFLTAAEPTVAPPRLDFSSTALGHDFATLAPAIGQTFFIGDGKTAASLTQQFTVPTGATRLFLGLADAYGFADEPGTYYDNSGSFSATFTMSAPPVASPDAYSVIGGATLSVPPPGVLGNDTDPDNDPLTAVLDSTTTGGSLALHPNGSFTYTPGENTVGTDSFTYHANDGTANSNTVTVTLTVQAGCDGRRATQVGTAGNDELGGTGGNDVIVGLGGNDVIEPGSGTDIVCGGSGRDTVEAGSGNDTVFGGSGDDLLDGGSGNDRLFGEDGIDRLFGGGDNDALDGGAGTPDRCDGEGGSDTATACETVVSVP